MLQQNPYFDGIGRIFSCPAGIRKQFMTPATNINGNEYRFVPVLPLFPVDSNHLIVHAQKYTNCKQKHQISNLFERFSAVS